MNREDLLNSGYFDWEVLNQYGGDGGCFYCNTEDEICNALSVIKGLLI